MLAKYLSQHPHSTDSVIDVQGELIISAGCEMLFSFHQELHFRQRSIKQKYFSDGLK